MTPEGVSKIIRGASRSHPPPPLSAFAAGQVDGGRIFVDTINGRLLFGGLPPQVPRCGRLWRCR